MIKRGVKYTLLVLLGMILIYHAVYFKSLQRVKADAKGFDIDRYARDYLFKLIPQSKTDFTDIALLHKAIQKNSSEAFKAHSYAASEGDLRYMMVTDAGVVTQKDSSYVWLKNGEGQAIKLAAKYIYGTAARDAAGLIVVDSFNNTMLFNELSEKINYLIRKEITPVLQEVAVGDTIRFTGALGLSRKAPQLAEARIIPLLLKRSRKESK